MPQPLISILVPAYNVEDYVGQCLQSIVGQTYGNLQVVVVDDGSTDRTGAICDDYAARYPFLEVVHAANGGVAAARNTLLSKIQGEYFLFVDADDWVEPDMVASLVALALRHSLDIVVCDCVKEDGGPRPEVFHDTAAPTIWDRATSIRKFLLHKELNGSLWNKLVLTSLFHKVAFNPAISYGEDALAVWQSLHRLNRLGITRSTFYHYRMNAVSISHQPFGAKKMTGHIVWQTISRDTARLYPDLARLARACFAVSDFWLLYYAAMDSYPGDDNIRHYRANLRENLPAIGKLRLLDPLKYLTAAAFAASYPLAAKALRLFRG